VLVLTLTPALVAGVIADEKRRKTLHYVLASRLTGPEIVIGKLMARMLHLGVLLGVSFPVLSLMVLLGGIDPWLIVLSCGAAASTAWFLAALSIWVSTIAKRAREALFIAFGLEFLWLCLPMMARLSPTVGWAIADQIIWEAMDWLAASSPFGPGQEFVFALRSGATGLATNVATMIRIQLVAGFVFAALAAISVRPVFKAQEGAEGGRRGLLRFLTRRRTGRVLPRPALGDAPMLWKELFTSRARGFARFVAVVITLVSGGFLLYYSIWFAAMAFLEWRDYGDQPAWQNWVARSERMKFLWFIRAVVPLLYIVGILSVAGAAAASITSEHEDDTWTSLTSTDLTAREIILAKLLGSLWRPRGIVVYIVLLTLAGCLVGSLDPLSLPFLVVSLVVFGWFAVALGTWISLQLKSTWRAQFLTVACLLLTNISGQAILSNVQRWAPLLWPGFTPYEISKTILAPNFRREWSAESRPSSLISSYVEDTPFWHVSFSILSLVGYGTGALGLTLVSLRAFETVAGRPCIPRKPHPELVSTLSKDDTPTVMGLPEVGPSSSRPVSITPS
jgi:ABC-type transport system involved in multi-copper enzyme maturation permease subunit